MQKNKTIDRFDWVKEPSHLCSASPVEPLLSQTDCTSRIAETILRSEEDISSLNKNDIIALIKSAQQSLQHLKLREQEEKSKLDIDISTFEREFPRTNLTELNPGHCKCLRYHVAVNLLLDDAIKNKRSDLCSKVERLLMRYKRES